MNNQHHESFLTAGWVIFCANNAHKDERKADIQRNFHPRLFPGYGLSKLHARSFALTAPESAILLLPNSTSTISKSPIMLRQVAPLIHGTIGVGLTPQPIQILSVSTITLLWWVTQWKNTTIIG